MQPEARKYLWDALNAADLIANFIAGRGLEYYLSDPMLRAAVERELEIIGEALGKFSKREPEVAAKIPQLARIVSFRNVLAHGYATVDDKIVWGIVDGKLSDLSTTLRNLLGEG